MPKPSEKVQFELKQVNSSGLSRGERALREKTRKEIIEQAEVDEQELTDVQIDEKVNAAMNRRSVFAMGNDHANAVWTAVWDEKLNGISEEKYGPILIKMYAAANVTDTARKDKLRNKASNAIKTRKEVEKMLESCSPAIAASRLAGLAAALKAREGGTQAMMALGLMFDPPAAQDSNGDEAGVASRA